MADSENVSSSRHLPEPGSEFAPPGPTRPTRRAVLRGTGFAVLAAGLAGCGIDVSNVRWDRAESTTAPPTPDETARAAALADLESLRTSAMALTTGAPLAPPLAAAVRRALADYEVHLSALGAPEGATASGTAGATTTPTLPSTPPTPGPAPTPRTHLVAENAAATRILTELATVSGPMSRLLTSIGASLLVHVEDLATLSRTPVPTRPVARPNGVPALGSGQFHDYLSAPVPPGGTATATPTPTHPSLLAGVVSTDALAGMTRFADASWAAEYGYGIVGARSTGPARARAMTRMGVHRLAAQGVQELAEFAGNPGLYPRASYPPRGALHLELDTAQAAADLVAFLGLPSTPAPAGSPQDNPAARLLMVDAVVDRVLAARTWGAVPALPGLSEHA